MKNEIENIKNAIWELAQRAESGSYIGTADVIYEILNDTCRGAFHKEKGNDFTPCGKCGRARKL